MRIAFLLFCIGFVAFIIAGYNIDYIFGRPNEMNAYMWLFAFLAYLFVGLVLFIVWIVRHWAPRR